MKHLTKEQLAQLKQKLLEEQERIEANLGGVGRMVGDGDWAATPPALDNEEEDPVTQADRYEEFYNRGGTVAQLESRLAQVNHSLANMEAGTYGISEVSGKPIEAKRLMANPAATTTVDEMDKEPVRLGSEKGGIFDQQDDGGSEDMSSKEEE